MTGGDEVVAVINALAARFDHVVMTQDWHPGGHSSFASAHPGHSPFETVRMPYGAQTLLPDHCVQGTRGAEIHAGLALPNCAMIVRKGFRTEIDSYSAFRENDRQTATGLAGYLRERGLARLYLAGLATDFCVHFSAVDARAEGFEACVIDDACRAIDVDGSLATARENMRAAGVGFVAAADLRAPA
jgi:nicotinamidase/pyrazinamidase